MTLREELSKMLPQEQVCVRTQSGIVCTNKAKKVKDIMNTFLDFEVLKKEISFERKIFHKNLVKTTTIYI